MRVDPKCGNCVLQSLPAGELNQLKADLKVVEPADQTDIELAFLPPFHPAGASSVVHVFALRLHSVALAEGRKEAAHSREGQAAIGCGPHVG